MRLTNAHRIAGIECVARCEVFAPFHDALLVARILQDGIEVTEPARIVVVLWRKAKIDSIAAYCVAKAHVTARQLVKSAREGSKIGMHFNAHETWVNEQRLELAKIAVRSGRIAIR